MSVADAVGLAALVKAGNRDLLGDHQRLRHPANEHSLLFIRRAAATLSLPARALDFGLPWLLRRANARPERLARLLRLASAAFHSP